MYCNNDWYSPQDVIVPAPRRASSSKNITADAAEPPPWARLSSWGGTGGGGAPTSYNPFGEHPLQQALAANYRFGFEYAPDESTV